MIDKATITIKSGNGGNGAQAFQRRKGKTFGPPTGGDGGKGGDVYFVASSHMATLADFRHRKQFMAHDGGAGNANQRSGERGQDLVIEVPRGTVLINAALSDVIIDMANTQETVLVARGGEGGRGNMRMRRKASHARGQIPWDAWQWVEEGKPGETYTINLELKLIADIGLVGMPNAGKSTLLSVLTSAKPKIANYPFTTLEPNLGVMQVPRFLGSQVPRNKQKMSQSNNPVSQQPSTLIIADIPGLIEGASRGKGLGKEFLRHVERTRVLLHLTQNYEDYTVIRNELGKYSKDLLEKPEIVVLSKIDAIDKDILQQLKKELLNHNITPLEISAVTHEGLDKLQKKLLEIMS